MIFSDETLMKGGNAQGGAGDAHRSNPFYLSNNATNNPTVFLLYEIALNKRTYHFVFDSSSYLFYSELFLSDLRAGLVSEGYEEMLIFLS